MQCVDEKVEVARASLCAMDSMLVRIQRLNQFGVHCVLLLV